MKIVAQTGGGFLVEMSTEEVAKAAGYSCTYDDGWENALKKAGNYDSRNPKIGMTVEVRAAYDFHSRITKHEGKAKEAAGTLRALAKLLDGAMPSVLIPPARDAPKGEE